MSHHDIIIGRLDEQRQTAILAALVTLIEQAPLFQPVLPRWGTPFSVKMTNCGPLGWVSDKSGYRYQPLHPHTQRPWPQIPDALMRIWDECANYALPPEACLINHYAPGAKMGLHQDKDEDDFDAPVLSVSLGDDARFRLGGTTRKGPTESFVLGSGDVMIMARENRLAFHGVDKIYPGTSDLLAPYAAIFPGAGRINLTLRRVSSAR